MIESVCTCGQSFGVRESAAPTTVTCAGCGTSVHLVTAEQLAEGAGLGDFDACLVVERGPHNDRVGHVYMLGGVPPITVGKLSTSHVLLPGSNVSRHHATLERVDFGPSRWKVVDNQSTNGLWVNGERVANEHELVEGDVLTVGDYDLKFQMAAAPVEAAVATPAMPAPAPAVPPPVRTGRTGRQIGYARPGATRPGDDTRALGDSDPNWVMTLRNASHLLVLGATCNILASCMGGVRSPMGMLFSVGAAVLSFLGAWMLSKGEPGAPTVVTAILLRVAAGINVAGSLLVLLGDKAEQPAIEGVGTVLSLAAVPQFFLLLWTLRRLAIRLPNPTLAVNAAIVMIGFPAAIFVMIGGVAMAVVLHSTAMLVLGGVSGIAMFVFAIWYIIVLVWFNKSFS